MIERRCPECGFEAGSVVPEQVARLVRENAAEWLRILGQSARLTERPSDERWSALEYASNLR